MTVKQRLDHDQTTDGHHHPRDVSLETALDALADPIRRSIVRHFATLRGAGLLEQRADATRRLNRLRRSEFDERFPGLLALVINEPSD